MDIRVLILNPLSVCLSKTYQSKRHFYIYAFLSVLDWMEPFEIAGKGLSRFSKSCCSRTQRPTHSTPMAAHALRQVRIIILMMGKS